MGRLAIVGGGMAGLGAAWALRETGITITLFEAAPRLGGRVSTVERGPVRFDDGAQFIRTEMPLAAAAILDTLPRGDLVDVRRDVLPFDRGGAIGVGDPAQNAQPKWVYRDGLRTLPRLLWAGAPPRTHLGWRVDALRHERDGWHLAGPRGEAGPFDAVLVTLPPAAAGALLARSRGPGLDAAREAYAGASHRPIVSVALGSELVEPPDGAYALVNSDREHAVSWLAFEDAKPGYVPAGSSVLVAQMAGPWSAPRLGLADREIAEEAAQAMSGLLGHPVRLRWWHVTRWPEALPDALANRETARTAEAAGLFLAGDAFAGGRAHLALETGFAAAERIAARLAPR